MERGIQGERTHHTCIDIVLVETVERDIQGERTHHTCIDIVLEAVWSVVFKERGPITHA